MEEASLDDQVQLVRKIAKLISAHGSDVLLTPESEPLPAFHRLRTGLSSKLWQWRTICGWHWRRSPGQDPEHINKLGLRALCTALKWRVERQGLCQSRFLHLCDSMVSLHIVNKCRSSSRKMRWLMRHLCALVLAAGLSPILAYVDTADNPADRPSRHPQKRKWAA